MNDEQPAEKTEAQSETVSETVQEGQTARRTNRKVNFYSFDALRVLCITLLTFSSFSLPFPVFELVRPYLGASTGILFTLYGFLVLRDEKDLSKNIKHAIKVFAILFAVYGLMTMGYLLLVYGNPFVYFTKRGIFNFVVFNYWGDSFCSTIWYVQSVLYSLIIFRLLRSFKKYDWILCIVLFIISVLIGELARVINFSFLGNDYIPGNFLTRTMPYMLLGRLVHRYYGKARTGVTALGVELILVGTAFCVAELLILAASGKLGYINHLIGFIPISAGACMLAARYPSGGKIKGFARYSGRMYKGMYYVFNPLGYLLLLAGLFVFRTQQTYAVYASLVGLAVAVINLVVFFIYSRGVHKRNVKKAIAMKKEKEKIKNEA